MNIEEIVKNGQLISCYQIMKNHKKQKVSTFLYKDTKCTVIEDIVEEEPMVELKFGDF